MIGQSRESLEASLRDRHGIVAKRVGFGGLDKYVSYILIEFDIIVEESGCWVIFSFVGRRVF